MTWMPDFWQFYLMSDMFAVIGTAVTMYWLTTKKHLLLKKIGLRDGFYSSNVVYKAGGELVRVDFNGPDAAQALKNIFSSFFPQKSPEEMMKERVHLLIARQIIKEIGQDDITKIKIKELVQEIMNKELDQFPGKTPPN